MVTKRTVVFIGWAIVLMAMAAAGTASEQFWAQVTFVRGEVSLRSAGKSTGQSLSRGMVLHDGDTVRAGKGGQASLLVSDGSIVVVRAGNEVVLGPADRPATPSLKVVAGNLSRTLLSRQGDNPMLKHLGGLRTGERNLVLAPTRTQVREPVQLVWAHCTGVSRYAVTVMGPVGMVYEGLVEGNRCELPIGTFESGLTYYWEVRDAASRDTFTALGSGSFITLAAESAEAVASLEKALSSAFDASDPGEDSSALFLAYQLYRESGLNLRALEVLQRLLAADPEDQEVRRWSETLCEELGLEAGDLDVLFPADRSGG